MGLATKTLVKAHPTVDMGVTLDSDSEGAVSLYHPVVKWNIEVEYSHNGVSLLFPKIVTDSDVVGGNPYAVSKQALLLKIDSDFDTAFDAYYKRFGPPPSGSNLKELNEDSEVDTIYSTSAGPDLSVSTSVDSAGRLETRVLVPDPTDPDYPDGPEKDWTYNPSENKIDAPLETSATIDETFPTSQQDTTEVPNPEYFNFNLMKP